MVSPVLFMKKKDRSLYLIQDLQKLKAMTVKNAYPSCLSQTSSIKYLRLK